jgi:aminobenzoyl-glutamate utilization protein B
MPNRPLAGLIVANMREIGAPTYTKNELEFARRLGETVPHEEKVSMLRKLAEILPSALELEHVDLDMNIYDPFGEEVKGGGGSSDVADVAWNTPTQQFSTAYFVVGCPGHSWQHTAIGGTSVAHKSTIFASKVMATTAIDLLTKPDLLRAARDDWERRMKGLAYKSPLPPDLKPPLDQLPPMAE